MTILCRTTRWLHGGILANVSAYDAQAAVRSALATWVGVARARMAESVVYATQHAKAHAEVLPIIDQLIRETPHVSHVKPSQDRPGPSHWYQDWRSLEPVRPPNWDIQLYGDNSIGAYWQYYTAEIVN